MEILIRHIQNMATWRRSTVSRGNWLGIDATKSNGKSPILIKVLAKLEERTHAFSFVWSKKQSFNHKSQTARRQRANSLPWRPRTSQIMRNSSFWFESTIIG